MTGGDESSLPLSLLLGEVLNGDTSAPSGDVSGARRPPAFWSMGCDLGGILGLPARLIGGGATGAAEAGRSLFWGSAMEGNFECEEKSGLVSRPGVASRLCILNGLVGPFEVPGEGVGEWSAAWDFGREGRGAWIWASGVFAGDRGDWTKTLGGDLVGDLGGEKAIMDVGRGLALPRGEREVLARGVTDAVP